MSLFMVQAQEFAQELQGRGVTLRPTPEGNIRFRPKSAVSPEDRRRIREYKQELLIIFRLEERIEPSPSSPPSPQSENPHKCGKNSGDGYGDDIPRTVTTEEPEFVRRRREKAEALGLVARWSYEFGYISLHDPTTGEWHDIETNSAPDWAKKECFKRKDLRNRGTRRLLNREEMERVYAEDIPPVWSTANLAVTKDGVVYSDYLVESYDD